MRAARRAAVEAAVPARRWGLVLGTLGRQARASPPRKEPSKVAQKLEAMWITRASRAREILVPSCIMAS